MHGRMAWGHDPHKRYSGAGMELDVPLVPAPHVWAAAIIGMLVGVMIGYKKAKLAQMHSRMMGGMGHGMMGGGMRYGGDGDWMSRKKAMMQAMAAHHHHGYGSAPCCCGADVQPGAAQQGADKGEDTENYEV